MLIHLYCVLLLKCSHFALHADINYTGRLTLVGNRVYRNMFKNKLSTCLTIKLDSSILLYHNEVASESEITPCNKIDNPLVVYRFTGNVMTSITTRCEKEINARQASHFISFPQLV